MEISKQACSLSLSKQLKEAGYPQEGLWWWNTHYDAGHWLHRFGDGFDEMMVISSDKRNFMLKNYDIKAYRTYREYSAPTVAELGERLPRGLKFYKEGRINKGTIYFCSKGEFTIIEADTEADCRAKMWLYLKKE